MRNTCSSVSLNEISTTVLMDEEGRDAPLKRATWQQHFSNYAYK